MATLTGDNNDNSLVGAVDEYNYIVGSGGRDFLYGGYLHDYIDGGDGNDVIYGFDGSDYLYDNSGDNLIFANEGDDTVNVSGAGLGRAGHNKIDLGQGDDTAYLGGQRDDVSGGLGTDLVSYYAANGAVNVNLQLGKGFAGWAEGDTYRSIEDIEGSRDYDDILVGNGAYNTINGLGGNDTISGGAGGDEMDGGEGSDTLDYRTSSAGVKISLLTGEASGGDAAGDSFFNFENVMGSAFDDTLYGDDGSNSLTGNGGSDRLFGGGGNDRIAAGAGNDLLLGQAGADIMAGGAGADRFIYSSISDSGVPSATRDWIRDFSVSDGDRIDLSRIDANTNASGDQAFTFIGSSAFSGASGELRATIVGTNTLIYADVNGDKVADFSILLTGTPTLTSARFIL